MHADDLRDLEAHLRALPSPWAAVVAEGVAKYLAGSAASLDAALGLKPQPGQRRVSTVARTAERDRHLRAAAERFGLDAVALARRFGRFESGPWQRCQSVRDVPPEYAGRVEGYFFLALKAWPHPVKERQMRSILAAVND